jgi:hypothetical protein
MLNPKKTLLPLSTTLDKKLIAYAAAVGTTCAAALAMTQAAEAKIVYTPANRTILFDGKSILDLNNDHIADFVFTREGLGNFSSVFVHPFHASNQVVTRSYFAAALPAGAQVGPEVGFNGHNAAMEAFCECSGSFNYTGPWVNATDKYLGLEITINGQRHFGWARLTFVAYSQATLTGYAYESVADKPIVTGVTSDEVDSESDQGGNASLYMGTPSLGVLARGAEGLEFWRRDEKRGDGTRFPYPL